jgi:hypothetical protein
MTAVGIDAKVLKEQLTESQIRTVYELLGVARWQRNGESHIKCPSPLRPDSDRNPSFSVSKATGYWEDFVTGDKGDILAAVMQAKQCTLPDAITFVAETAGIPGSSSPSIHINGRTKRAPVVADFGYVKIDGSPAFTVERTEDKQFFVKQPDGPYGYGDARRVPYHLDEFPTDGRKWLVHCEGEKDTDRARLMGFNATTSPGGSNGWKPELKVFYTGLNVAIVPDNDEPGWKYAQDVARSLQGVANRVRIVELPDLGERLEKGGKDLSDWFDTGHNAMELNRLIRDTPDWTPAEEPAENPEPPLRFTLLTPRELANRPSPKWMIEGLLIEGTTSAVVGAPATMKSFIAKDWALCVAGGHQWNDRNVMQGPVVYISAEGSSGLPARIRAWEMHHDRTAPETCFFITDAVQFMEHGDVSDLLLAIDRLPITPIFVVVDTLARTLVGGDENSSRDMGLYVDGLDTIRRATGSHMMVIHHENKEGKTRGSTVLPGALDTEINVKRDEEVVTITCKKQKDAAEFDKLTLIQRVIDLGDGQSSLILEPLEFTSGTMSSIEHKVLHVLVDVFGKQGATTTNWKKACEEAGGITHATFYRSRKNLVERGLVKTDDDQQRGAIFTPVIVEEDYQDVLL